MKTIMFPGQGSQYKGMGKELFASFSAEKTIASEILGYDIEELCVRDPEKKLSQTQYAQPALYVVNALAYKKEKGNPDFLIGHSLGEYNALLAAGCFDFETGLKLVKKRGELMQEASGGGMAAVLDIDIETLKLLLSDKKYDAIDIANINTPTQIVVSGPTEGINALVKDFETKKIRIIPLFVNAAFHSRYMKSAATRFEEFLKQFKLVRPKIPVISNSEALPYDEEIKPVLCQQIVKPVRWMDSIQFLRQKGAMDFVEIQSTILTKMVNEISKKPIVSKHEYKKLSNNKLFTNKEEEKQISHIQSQPNNELRSEDIGSKEFKRDHNTKYAYVAGSMYRGIASKELVITMAKASMLSFLGTGGMSLSKIEENIQSIQKVLQKNEPYGMNLLHNLVEPEVEFKTVELFIKYNIRLVEASAFMNITKALAYYMVSGLKKVQGKVIASNKIIAKVSRPEIAELFMSPIPQRILKKLLDENLVSKEQISMATEIPVSWDICVEADSGGHTDRGIPLVLLPAIQTLRDGICKEHAYNKRIRVGLAGGIGTPQAAACAFVMGADFVLTGSINQCTIEAGTSDLVKDLLQNINVQDTTYAPAGDMFELGAKVQVLRKGVLFPSRANKLYELYKQYNSYEEIPAKIRLALERDYFKNEFTIIWSEVQSFLKKKGRTSEIEKWLIRFDLCQ
ncbi:ACP S-malonyltransferase [Aquimarina sp. RZ0]|uniref:ACP S-malonyltransferase n=1 Tax=Aquimarina sp. RZ0 TaxID=2607730 RepID=UPI0011F1820D|nr:ACP S-malonyltransferase [Aquimarina sp. RZ0]KAA1242932.1 ACP S-malonyltransferase [Aquimarina sp. RZ0]